MKQRKINQLMAKQDRQGWLFVLPFVIGFVFLYLDVLINSAAFSFTDINIGTSKYTLTFTGIKHYIEALTVDPDFIPALLSSVSSFFKMVPIVLIFSLFTATLLNQKTPGRAVFRSIFFIPVILMTGVVALSDSSNAIVQSMKTMQGTSAGISSANTIFDLKNVSDALQNLSINTGMINFILNLINDIYGVVNHSGVQIILFLAALQSISPSIYEAASIEGASGWESFWKITLPMVSPVVLVNAVYTSIELFTESSNPIMILVDKLVNNRNGYGLASAISWMYFLIICVLLGVIALIGKKFVFEQT